MTYYKATRLDGTDFHRGTTDYAAALVSGEVIRHPAKRVKDQPSTYLSVSVEPADCTAFEWPCRLFRVEPVGRPIRATGLPNKRAVSALRVVEELPAHMALGPNGEFVRMLLAAPIPRIALENPVSIISSRIRKPDQIIQPWQFGHGETKATCLWLKNLPPLRPTNIVEGREQRVHRMPPGPDRWRERSRTFPGIAEAMADQWGEVMDFGMAS